MTLILVLRTSAAAVLLWRRARVIARLRIAARLLVISTHFLLGPLLLELRLTTLLLVLLEFGPALLVVTAAIVVSRLLLKLWLATGLLMLLEFRPALLPVVVERLRLAIIPVVSVEAHRAFFGSSLRMSTVVPCVEAAVVAGSFHMVHLH